MQEATSQDRAASRADERSVLLWGGLTLFLVGWAAVSVTNAGETLFLKRVGVDLLPLVFLVNSGLLAMTTYLVGRRAAATEHGHALTLTLAVTAVLLLLLWIGAVLKLPGVLGVLVVAAKQIQAVALLVFWIAMGGWVDSRQAKRLVPPMLAGGTLGAVLGSFTSGPLGSAVGISSLILVAAVALSGAAAATLVLRAKTLVRLGGAQPRRQRRDEDRLTLRRLWKDSGLFRMLAVAGVLSGMLAPVLYFLFSVAADAATAGRNGEQELLHLYGNFRGFMNIAILALQLGGTSWLFRHIGVPRAAILAPVISAAGFIAFASVGGIAVAITVMAAATLQDKALAEPAERTLATLFPENARATVTALLDGPLKRCSGAAGNLVVLSTITLGAQTWLPVLAAPLALVWLGVAAALARVYPSLLLEAAGQTRFGRGQAPDAEQLDPRTTRQLAASLLDPDPRQCRATCELLLEAPTEAAVGAIAGALRKAPGSNFSALLETLDRLSTSRTDITERRTRLSLQNAARAARKAARERDDLIGFERARICMISGMLGTGPDGDEQAALEALCGAPGSDPALRLAGSFLRGEDGVEAVLSAAASGDDADSRTIALHGLRTLLLRADGAERPETVEQRLMAVAALLADTRTRRQAGETLARIASRHRGRLDRTTEMFLAYRQDPDPAVRAALLRFIGATGNTAEARWAVGRLASADTPEVEAATQCLRELGPDAIEVILESFHCDGRRTRDALLPVLRDIPMSAGQLTSLIEDELDEIRHVMELERQVGPVTTSVLFRQRMRERVEESTRAALSLYATVYRDARIAELGPLLERVRSGRERAVLLEALEALLPGGRTAPLMRLLDSGEESPAAAETGTAANAGIATTNAGGPEATDAILRRALTDRDSLTRAFLAASLEPASLERLGGYDEIRPDEPAHALVPIHTRLVSREPDNKLEDAAMLSGVEIVLHLRALALFERLRTRELTELAGIVRQMSFERGKRIVAEGDFDDCMYLVIEGTVEVTRRGARLGELGAQDFFGEMAILDGETRSATVTASNSVRLLRIDRDDLLRVMDERPGIAISICQTLSRRVRELNEAVRKLQQPSESSGSKAH